MATAPSLPGVARADEESRAPLAVDVQLREGGVLVGQLVSQEGKPLANAPVTIKQSDGSDATAMTNAEGGFAFRGVRGTAHVEAEQAAALVRGWAPRTAPPSATPGLLLVKGEPIVRGQGYSPVANGFVERSKRLMANPLFVATVVGAAVAIPVAIHNADDDDPAS